MTLIVSRPRDKAKTTRFRAANTPIFKGQDQPELRRHVTSKIAAFLMLSVFLLAVQMLSTIRCRMVTKEMSTAVRSIQLLHIFAPCLPFSPSSSFIPLVTPFCRNFYLCPITSHFAPLRSLSVRENTLSSFLGPYFSPCFLSVDLWATHRSYYDNVV